MVNTWGEWKYIPDTPDEKKCSLDYVADIVTATGYKPENVSLEYLCEYLLAEAEANFESADSIFSGLYLYDKNGMIIPEAFRAWIETQTISDFDYTC